MTLNLKKILLVPAFLLVVLRVSAVEGMWLPFLLKQLNEKEMKKMGLRISAEDIYSINRSSLKDAIFLFGGGCTSEIVSSQGLLFTNHHCGYGQIQSHSTVEKDYLKNGFVAKNTAEELPNNDLTATRIVRIEDVTNAVMQGITPTMSEEERNKKIEANSKAIVEKAIKDTHYEAVIKPFYYGNEFYMIVSETFKDIRLVFAPPASVGKYGADTDNWMWPRHTGDFCVFRIYAGKDNKPAAYSKENIPYKPMKHLSISLKGVQKGDFTMVYGFPGTTQQYLSSYAVDYVMNTQNPMRIKMREASLSVIDASMKSSDDLRIRYAAKQARIANGYKKWIGESKGLKKLNALEVKRSLEQQFTALASALPEYSGALSMLKDIYGNYNKVSAARDLYVEYLLMGPEMFRFVRNCSKVIDQYEKVKDTPEWDKSYRGLSIGMTGFYKDYDMATDRKIFVLLSGLFDNYVSNEYKPAAFSDLKAKYNADWQACANDIYANSVFTSKIKLTKFLENINTENVRELREKDPLYILSKAMFGMYTGEIDAKYTEGQDKIQFAMRTYVRGLKKLLPDYRRYWPDANSTLRVAYGKVEGFIPSDGAEYRYYTTAEGILQKYIPGDYEFDLDPKLKDLLLRKDYGRYAKNGELRIAFTASNHTTGGNSGSPVLNGNGELIGINFDRAWESTMSDIMYDPDRCRNIIVDAGYVLWVIEKWGGADHLINEMTIVR
jgi:hypothetical protein